MLAHQRPKHRAPVLGEIEPACESRAISLLTTVAVTIVPAMLARSQSVPSGNTEQQDAFRDVEGGGLNVGAVGLRPGHVGGTRAASEAQAERGRWMLGLGQ